MSLSSPNDHHRNRSKHGKRTNNVGETTNRRHTKPYFYYRLAPETPLPALFDESSYDSFHNLETDVCKDTSDDDNSDANSSHTEGFAVMDVIEYDVADDSESEDVSTASSGTDDFAIAAATEAYSRFSALLNANCSDDDDDEFILADTEEEDSDDSIDLELSHADFWKCVKCNNKQNNPLYRYCERCYQVRKSLFPPRPTPRHQKPRANVNGLKRKITCLSQESTSEVDSDSDVQVSSSKKMTMPPNSDRDSILKSNGNRLSCKNNCNSGNSNHGNSAGECSSTSHKSSGSDEDGETLASPERKCVDERVCKIQVNPLSSIEISKVQLSGKNLTPNHYSSNGYSECKIENRIIQSVYEQEISCSRSLLRTQDSGLSSCHESSQEMSTSKRYLSTQIFAGQSVSPRSTQSFESQNDYPASQEFINVQNDSDIDNSDNDEIMTRVEKFTLEREKNVDQKRQLALTGSQTYSDSVIDDVNDSILGTCRFCMINPKNGVFVHSNCLHLCCCYKCAVKVWKKRKSCPICNCKIKNVTKLFVH